MILNLVLFSLSLSDLSFDDITAVFGTSMAIKPYARKCGVAVLKFKVGWLVMCMLLII